MPVVAKRFNTPLPLSSKRMFQILFSLMVFRDIGLNEGKARPKVDGPLPNTGRLARAPALACHAADRCSLKGFVIETSLSSPLMSGFTTEFPKP